MTLKLGHNLKVQVLSLIIFATVFVDVVKCDEDKVSPHLSESLSPEMIAACISNTGLDGLRDSSQKT